METKLQIYINDSPMYGAIPHEFQESKKRRCCFSDACRRRFNNFFSNRRIIKMKVGAIITTWSTFITWVVLVGYDRIHDPFNMKNLSKISLSIVGSAAGGALLGCLVPANCDINDYC